jgi:Na+-translocating ferredoxin:NAD+ oxidoreductase subunit G
MNENKPQTGGGYLRQAWLVIVLAALYSGALAGVESTLGPKIQQNKENETLGQVPALVPGSVKGVSVTPPVVGKDGKECKVFRAVGADGRTIGWVLPTGGQGFADRIELLVGLDASMETITGLFILDQKETPGLGDNITGEDFRGRFLGKNAEPPLVIVTGKTETPNQIRAITGATISSESVCKIVNDTIKNLREPILALPSQPAIPAGTK